MSILDDFYKILKNSSCNDEEFRDSVVVITKDGVLREEFLDEMPYNHATLTCYMASKLNFPYLKTDFSIVAGSNLASNGVIVMHIHKDGICICFFPEEITYEQFKMFESRALEIRSFNFQYDESKQEEGFVSFDNVLGYAKSIVKEDVKVLNRSVRKDLS